MKYGRFVCETGPEVRPNASGTRSRSRSGKICPPAAEKELISVRGCSFSVRFLVSRFFLLAGLSLHTDTEEKKSGGKGRSALVCVCVYVCSLPLKPRLGESARKLFPGVVPVWTSATALC